MGKPFLCFDRAKNSAFLRALLAQKKAASKMGGLVIVM